MRTSDEMIVTYEARFGEGVCATERGRARKGVLSVLEGLFDPIFSPLFDGRNDVAFKGEMVRLRLSSL